MISDLERRRANVEKARGIIGGIAKAGRMAEAARRGRTPDEKDDNRKETPAERLERLRVTMAAEPLPPVSASLRATLRDENEVTNAALPPHPPLSP